MNSLQAANQYDFTVNKSSEEAIVDIIDEIEMARSTKQHALVISLDIKGAFHHLEYNSIKSSLNNINFHSNTKETLIDLLSDRQVALNTPQGPATLSQHRGCPQGSCTVPAIWNFVRDEVLTQSWPEGVHLQAFSDDFIFLIKAPTKAKVKSLANEALNQFKSWTAKHNLEISANKSNYMHFNKNRNDLRWLAGIRCEDPIQGHSVFAEERLPYKEECSEIDESSQSESEDKLTDSFEIDHEFNSDYENYSSSTDEEEDNLTASRGLKRMRLLTDSEDDSEESNERQNIEIAMEKTVWKRIETCSCPGRPPFHPDIFGDCLHFNTKVSKDTFWSKYVYTKLR
ncbi:hypothetical protein AVEN_111328-1 [Araneus ventricosus]|uniref:Reverse transcriptase domain-containing protein n=1 Tax=Araneus ventricosus TaxID=182803 RepID=A0A4Y2GH96_ARAVE|nr:hypothetical protein AVEN_111328-1 [Araneus ventricosus]